MHKRILVIYVECTLLRSGIFEVTYIMNEDKIIEVYNKGITEVISLIKNMNNRLNRLTSEIARLKKENKELTIKLEEFEAKSNKNSSNSSKPPSSDGFKKPRNSRIKSGKHTGGQLGHKGKTLEKIENPDEVIDINVHTCECGCCLSDVESEIRSR